MAKAAGKKFQISEELNKSMVTAKFRVSYEHVIEPWTNDPDKDARYSCQCIFDMDDPKAAAFIKKAKSIVKNIAIEAFGPNAIKLMRSGKLKNPFRSGDDEFPDDDTYKNTTFFNANGPFVGKKPPGLFDQHRRNMREMANVEEIFFSGVYARAEIKFYPFDREGGKGVACYLFRVQYWETGEPLGGGRKVEDVFDEIETDDDDWVEESEEDEDF